MRMDETAIAVGLLTIGVGGCLVSAELCRQRLNSIESELTTMRRLAQDEPMRDLEDEVDNGR